VPPDLHQKDAQRSEDIDGSGTGRRACLSRGAMSRGGERLAIYAPVPFGGVPRDKMVLLEEGGFYDLDGGVVKIQCATRNDACARQPFRVRGDVLRGASGVPGYGPPGSFRGRGRGDLEVDP